MTCASVQVSTRPSRRCSVVLASPRAVSIRQAVKTCPPEKCYPGMNGREVMRLSQNQRAQGRFLSQPAPTLGPVCVC